MNDQQLMAETAQLRAEVAELKQQLADRKIIEKAKGLLMRRCGINEEDAYRRLQLTANNRRIKMVVLAGQVLEGVVI